MANITELLQTILSARYGKDVRQAIHDGIDKCYKDATSRIPGADGKSAYDYAKDGGYTGTVAEFAAKLAQENPTKEEFNQLSTEAKESIADLYQTKAGAIIEKASGESPLCIRDTADNLVRNLKLYGNTEQDGTSGKNLLKNTATTQTVNGVTFTVNDDGTVTVNGTATGHAYFYIDSDLSSGNYIVNGCPKDGSNGTYKAMFQATKDGSLVFPFSGDGDIGNGTTITISEGMIYLSYVIRIASGTTVSNLVFKPMIRLASITDDTYEPYTGGIASPNPDYPQEIKSVVVNEVKAHGKNFLNARLNTEITSNDQYFLYNVKPNREYTMTICQEMVKLGAKTTAAHNISFYKKDGSRIGYINLCVLAFTKVGEVLTATQTITIPEETAYVRIDLGTYYTSDVTSTVKTLYAQFEEGSVATEVVPYTENSITLSKPIVLNGPNGVRDRFVEKDGVYGVVRRIGKLGGDDLEYHSGVNEYGIVGKRNTSIKGLGTSYVCNMLQGNKMWYSNSVQEPTVEYNLSTNGGLYVAIKEGTDLSDFDFRYILAEPTFEPLPTADQIALRSLLSYYGTTHIETDSEVTQTIEAECVLDTKRYIDRKFAELATALV